MRAPLSLAITLLPLAGCGQMFSAAGPATDAGHDALTSEGGPPVDGSPSEAAADAPADVACGDTASSPDNCGRCGHSCLGGTCSAGVCQPLTLAEQQSAPTSLVAYDYTAGTRVVWSQTGTTGPGAVSECHFGSTASCSPTSLQTATHPRQLVKNDTAFFWFDAAGTGSILSVPVVCSPCTATAVTDLAQPSGGTLVAGMQNLFWTNGHVGPGGDLYGDTAGGGPGALLVAGITSSAAAVTIDTVAVTVDYVDGLAIKQCVDTLNMPCSPTIILDVAGTAVPNPPARLVAYGGTLYWTSPLDNAVAKCTPSSCASTLQVVAGGLSAPFGLDVDLLGVYWTERASMARICTATSGRIAMCPLTGCTGGPVVLSRGEACPDSIAVTGAAVAWADEGEAGTLTGAVRAIAK